MRQNNHFMKPSKDDTLVAVVSLSQLNLGLKMSECQQFYRRNLSQTVLGCLKAKACIEMQSRLHQSYVSQVL